MCIRDSRYSVQLGPVVFGMIEGGSKRQNGMLTIIITLIWRITIVLMVVVSSCSNNCSTRSTGLGTTTTTIVVDAYIVKNTNKHRIVINRGRIKSTTSSALLSRIITSNNMHSLNNGNIGRIRQRSNTRHQFTSLRVTLTSENDDDDKTMSMLKKKMQLKLELPLPIL